VCGDEASPDSAVRVYAYKKHKSKECVCIFVNTRYFNPWLCAKVFPELVLSGPIKARYVLPTATVSPLDAMHPSALYPAGNRYQPVLS